MTGAAGDGPAAAYDGPGARFLELVSVMDRLRHECPWDREQTRRSARFATSSGPPP